jgi:hypothetical protein
MFNADNYSFLRNCEFFSNETKSHENYLFSFIHQDFYGEIIIPYEPGKVSIFLYICDFDVFFRFGSETIERKSAGGDLTKTPIWFQNLVKEAEDVFFKTTRLSKLF